MGNVGFRQRWRRFRMVVLEAKSKATTANSADSSSVEVDTTDYRKLYTVRKIAGTRRESLERESMPGLSPEKESTRGLDHLMFAPAGAQY